MEGPYDRTSGGGIGACIRALLPEFADAGHRVTVIVKAKTAGEDRYFDGQVRVVSTVLPGLHWYAGKIPGLARFVHPLRQLEWSGGFREAAEVTFRGDPPDVIESPETGAFELARKPLAPLIVRLHGSNFTFQKFSGVSAGPGSRLDRTIEISALKRAAGISSPSRFQAQELEATAGIGSSRVQVIPNPVSQFVIEAGRSHQPDPSMPELVLYTGRMAQVKGLPVLLKAAAGVCRDRVSARFLMAGPWQMQQPPEDYGFGPDGKAEGGRIHWIGHVSWENTTDLYRQASVFVMPSWFESFGISVLEAMAFGLPVIASSAGALPEIVEDGKTGLLVPPGDAQALAEAIKRLLCDPALRSRLGNAGRETVARFAPKGIATETVRFYERVRQNARS